MFRLVFTLFLIVLPMRAISAAIYQPIGPMLGYGNGTIPREVMSLGQNPAAPASVQGDGAYHWDEAISLNPSISFEIGDIGKAQSQYDVLNAYDYNNITPSNIGPIVSDTDAFFSALSKYFYVKSNVATNIPFLPLVTGSRSFGSLYLSADITSQTRLRYLDSPVQITSPTSISVSGAMYAKSAYRGDLSLGYSRELMEIPLGTLYIGGKLNSYYVGTDKVLSSASFDMSTNTVTTSSPSNPTFTTSRGADIDLGVMLRGNAYQAGMSVSHLGSPRFAYPSIGQNCSALSNASDQQNCYIAAAHSNDISLNEVHTMYPQAHIEGALLGPGSGFVLAAALDLNAVNDMMGDKVQYLSLSSSYSPDGWWSMLVPRVRMGFRKNLAGSGLTEMDVGLSLFRLLSLDVAESLDTTTINGTTYPRSLRINLGVGFNF